MLLEGIDLSQGKRRKRYSLPAAKKEEEREKAGQETRCLLKLFFRGEGIFLLTESDSSVMISGYESDPNSATHRSTSSSN